MKLANVIETHEHAGDFKEMVKGRLKVTPEVAPDVHIKRLRQLLDQIESHHDCGDCGLVPLLREWLKSHYDAMKQFEKQDDLNAEQLENWRQIKTEVFYDIV